MNTLNKLQKTPKIKLLDTLNKNVNAPIVSDSLHLISKIRHLALIWYTLSEG